MEDVLVVAEVGEGEDATSSRGQVTRERERERDVLMYN
jgi:hypothetical protein